MQERKELVVFRASEKMRRDVAMVTQTAGGNRSETVRNLLDLGLAVVKNVAGGNLRNIPGHNFRKRNDIKEK